MFIEVLSRSIDLDAEISKTEFQIGIETEDEKLTLANFCRWFPDSQKNNFEKTGDLLFFSPLEEEKVEEENEE